MLWKRTTRFQAKKLESFHRCFISRGAWGHRTLDRFIDEKGGMGYYCVCFQKFFMCRAVTNTMEDVQLDQLWDSHWTSSISKDDFTCSVPSTFVKKLVLFQHGQFQFSIFPGMERMWLREFFTTGCSGAAINEPCKSCERYLPTSVIQWLEWGWKSSPPQIYTGFVQLDFFYFLPFTMR